MFKFILLMPNEFKSPILVVLFVSVLVSKLGFVSMFVVDDELDRVI